MRALRIAALLFLLVVPALGQTYTIQQYLNIKSASSPSMSPDGREVAYLSNATGTTQVWATLISSPKPVQLTNYEDNISFVKWLGDGSGMVFGKAKGGDENTQFYWMDKFGGRVKALTNSPSVRHNIGAFSADGRYIYYASNKRDRNYFDIYSMDLDSGIEKMLLKQNGNNSVAAVNTDGSKLIISRDGVELSLDNNLYLLDTKTGKEQLLTPHKGSTQYGGVRFLPDGKSLVLGSDEGREFFTLANIRLKNAANSGDWSDANRELRFIDGIVNDVSGITMSDSPSTIAYATNREGFSELWLQPIETDGKPLVTFFTGRPQKIALPGQGVIGGMTFDRAQTKLAFSFSSPKSSGEIWVYDLETKSLKQITRSDQAGIDPKSFVAPELIKYKSFDGLEIPAWYYPPQGVEYLKLKNQPYRSFAFSKVVGAAGAQRLSSFKVPVIVSVHGGPESQSRPGFNPLFQYYLSRGYAVLDLNVRGSTGYGKTYTHLDDVEKREDSVKDLAYSVEWLKTKGGADPKKVAVMGGSYGGYMTMAAITLYPDLWAAAVASVAITNWETFLTNTSGYRRRQREVEYGRLDRDIDFLRRISPVRKIDRIKTPLFVISGRNDPRVPYTEGEQMVDALKKRGAPVQYKLYDDEGHGISKLKNRLDLYPLVADFLDKYMK
ncbi:MAG: S9 family peptidase [Pyrinomonadaceae bacterium]|nr:S9 family peptidase [Pyrinomonadaceae bacterium]